MGIARLRPLATFSIAIILSACGTTYKPTLTRLDPVGANSRKAKVDDLTVYAEEYLSAGKSERAFDTNFRDLNVFPILVRIENNGSDSYDIDLATISLTGDSRLSLITPGEAAGKATRDGVKQALGWGLVVPIISIPAAVGLSAMNTTNVNSQMASDFDRKSLNGGILRGGEERTGFLFFGVEPSGKYPAKLTLAMRLRNVTTNQDIIIRIPLPDIDIDEK
jgi:hypothetical protein